LGTEARSRAARGVALLTLVAALALPAVASADPPEITSGPTIEGYTGAPVVGDTLRAEATWTPVAGTQAAYSWLRCDPETGCAPITNADEREYQLVAADLGQRIAVDLVVRNEDGEVPPERSPLTEVVVAPPSPPDPDPEPEPARPPAPAPAPALSSRQTFEVQPTMAPNTMPPAGPPSARLPAYLRPFPVVRIRGNFAAGGVRITLLSVRAPRSSRIRARCTGRGCPVRAIARSGRAIRLRAFERFLPRGTIIRVRITSATRIGKYVSFRIRDSKAPLRADRCVMPAGSRPIRCPS
jgi:hypothetical protein